MSSRTRRRSSRGPSGADAGAARAAEVVKELAALKRARASEAPSLHRRVGNRPPASAQARSERRPTRHGRSRGSRGWDDPGRRGRRRGGAPRGASARGCPPGRTRREAAHAGGRRTRRWGRRWGQRAGAGRRGRRGDGSDGRVSPWEHRDERQRDDGRLQPVCARALPWSTSFIRCPRSSATGHDFTGLFLEDGRERGRQTDDAAGGWAPQGRRGVSRAKHQLPVGQANLGRPWRRRPIPPRSRIAQRCRAQSPRVSAWTVGARLATRARGVDELRAAGPKSKGGAAADVDA